MSEELDENSRKMWEMLADDEFVATGVVKNRKKLSKQEYNIRTQIRKLQKNSEIVVKECTELIEEYKNKECYFKANEARVAAMIHSNFIERLQLILDGVSIFNNIDDIPEDDMSIRVDKNIR